MVKMPLLPLPSTATTIDNATIGAVGSIPLLLLLTITAIATVDDCHRCCHTVNYDDHQKPAVVICLVDGGNGGHC
jgi:hypothetical protein